jgi:paired amphipathic helix protein Sin3a
VQQQIDTLLKSTPDLQAELKEFMPDGRSNSILGSVIMSATEWPGQKRKEPSSGLPAPAPKRKKKLAEKEIPSSKPSSSRQVKKTKHPQRMDSNEEYMYDANGIVSASGSMGHMTMGGMGMSTPDDQAFFERVKKTLDNRETYDEFLKLINMFTQDIIDMRTLLDKATYFLGEGTELSIHFRRIIGWEERERLVREPDDPSLGAQKNLAIYVPQGKEDLHHKCGPSYRRIPANVSFPSIVQEIRT